jgi:salicylate hydroxylase
MITMVLASKQQTELGILLMLSLLPMVLLFPIALLMLGIKSGAREGVVGRLVKPRDSGDLAYRVLLPSKLLLDDPELAPFIKEPWAQTWVGPDAHFVAYPIRGGELYNIIVCCTAESSFGKPFGDEDWRDESDPTELKLRLQGWHSPCQKLIGMAKQVRPHYDFY